MVHVYNDLLISILKQWTGGEWENRHKLKQGFIDHNEKIRKLVPREKLLEFRVQEGWEPLCKFLGKDVPDVPYPRLNEGDNAAKYAPGHFSILYVETLGGGGGMLCKGIGKFDLVIVC